MLYEYVRFFRNLNMLLSSDAEKQSPRKEKLVRDSFRVYIATIIGNNIFGREKTLSEIAYIAGFDEKEKGRVWRLLTKKMPFDIEGKTSTELGYRRILDDTLPTGKRLEKKGLRIPKPKTVVEKDRGAPDNLYAPKIQQTSIIELIEQYPEIGKKWLDELKREASSPEYIHVMRGLIIFELYNILKHPAIGHYLKYVCSELQNIGKRFLEILPEENKSKIIKDHFLFKWLDTLVQLHNEFKKNPPDIVLSRLLEFNAD